jgi:hypothetical protein
MPQCFDINNVPQDCSASSDAGGSSCFDDQAQEVSCAEVGGYANPAAVNAATTGKIAASASSGGGTSITSLVTSLGAVANSSLQLASGQPIGPSHTAVIGANGLPVAGGLGGNITTVLLVVVAVIIGFFVLSKK